MVSAEICSCRPQRPVPGRPVPAGHADVEEHEPDASPVAAEHLHGLVAGSREQDGVAVLLQDGLEESPRAQLVWKPAWRAAASAFSTAVAFGA